MFVCPGDTISTCDDVTVTRHYHRARVTSHEALILAFSRSIVHENSSPIYSPIVDPTASLRKKKKNRSMSRGYSNVSLKQR